MKKFGLTAIVAVMMFLFVGVSGCGLNVKSDVVNNLSDVRYSVFVGQSQGVVSNLMCGMRENPYSYDGKSNKKTEFGVITVFFENKPEEELHFSLSVGKTNYAGTLEENPYNHSFMADIQKIVDGDEGVYLTIEGVVKDMQLMPESKDWAVQYDKALDIAFEALEEDLMMLYSSRKFCGECYLKIVLDQSGIENPYYWCFMYVGQNGESGSVIIDVNTGEILTKSNAPA